MEQRKLEMVDRDDFAALFTLPWNPGVEVRIYGDRAISLNHTNEQTLTLATFELEAILKARQEFLDTLDAEFEKEINQGV